MRTRCVALTAYGVDAAEVDVVSTSVVHRRLAVRRVVFPTCFWLRFNEIMSTVTKKEIIERIAEKEGCRRSMAKRIIQSFLDMIVDELSHGHRLEFRDFGVFECRVRAPRQAQNPKTMEKVPVPSRRTVKFKVGRVMKRRLDEAPLIVDDATGLVLGTSVQKGAALGDGHSDSKTR